MAFMAVGDWLFGLFGKFDLALPAVNIVLVIGFVIFLKRRFWPNAWLWVTVIIIAVLHVLLLAYIPWTSQWVPALAMAGIDTIDFCAILLVLALAERLAKAVQH